MLKYFVLDTNVLIHNPQALYSFGDNMVIIPITVIEELDRFKNHSDKKGMHARQVIREIDSCIRKGALKEGAKMKNGGSLRIDLGPRKIITSINIDINDNRIIGAAYELQQKGETVFFVSKDVNARIKAEALGIKAVDYQKQTVEYSSLYKGWTEVTCSVEDIDSLYEHQELEAKGYTFHHNEYAVVKADNNSSSSAICKYNSNTNKLNVLRSHYDAMGIHPLNMEQKFAFDLLLDDKVKLVTLVGPAGTGKTLIAIACGLAKTIRDDSVYEKILVARPIIPMGKDIGFLPGSKNEKLNYWMQPIFDNLDFILKKSNYAHSRLGEDKTSQQVIDHLMKSNVLEIEALTYIRGRSIPDQYLIIDEAQNLTPHEIKTIISRVGENAKIVLTGDPHQIDNPYLDANSNGLTYIVERLKDKKIVGHILLSKSERSQLATLAVENL